jgi:hypothetical protein
LLAPHPSGESRAKLEDPPPYLINAPASRLGSHPVSMAVTGQPQTEKGSGIGPNLFHFSHPS